MFCAGQPAGDRRDAVQYEEQAEALEHVGELLVLLGNDGEPVRRVRVTDIAVRGCDNVSWKFAESEREDFSSVEDWRDGGLGAVRRRARVLLSNWSDGCYPWAVVSRRSAHPTPFVRSLSFGLVAELYERYRPDYPGEIVDAVLRYAGRPVRTAVEVGAGTGKATRLFASRGITVTALEPDAAMARVLERTTRGLPVEPVVSTFERFATDRAVDLVYAAAAWHWTDPATRWGRAVELLVPGGVLALFGGQGGLKDPDLSAALEQIERRVLPDDDSAAPRPWSIEQAELGHGLTDGAQRELPGVTTTTASDFVGRLSTVSAYLMLGPEVRAAALRDVRAVLPEQFEVDSTVQLSLARRV